jgi:hypothetical protein
MAHVSALGKPGDAQFGNFVLDKVLFIEIIINGSKLLGKSGRVHGERQRVKTEVVLTNNTSILVEKANGARL